MEKILRFGNNFGNYEVPLLPVLDSSALVSGSFDHFFLYSETTDNFSLDGIKLVYPTEIIESKEHLDIKYDGVMLTNLDNIHSNADLLIATRSFYVPSSNTSLSDSIKLSKFEDFSKGKVLVTDYDISTKIKKLFETGELSQSKSVSPVKLRDALLDRNL
ncbi:hypothetical protein HOA59_02915 [archaeon]|nr:hypothetical protein [archaeon]MBT7106912.1 hypothetical protein [archaeon]